MRFAALLFASVALSACTQVSHVKGPDGRDALLIDCPSHLECVQKAGELCPAGYNIHTNTTSVSGSWGAYSTPSSRNQVMVTCNPGGVVVQNEPEPESEPRDAPAPSTVTTVAARTPPARQDNQVCEAAHKHVQQFGQYWVKSTPGATAVAQSPRRRPFVSVCKSMPEEVQRCMHGAYVAANEQHCSEQFKLLATAAKDKIDALFLQ